MTLEDAIQRHRQICDELYELAMEENRFLQQHRRLPDASFLERKRGALKRLDEAITALRSAPPDVARDAGRKSALQKTQARIMQILQVDRENEQLLTRHSLSRGSAPAPASPDRDFLHRLYSRGS